MNIVLDLDETLVSVNLNLSSPLKYHCKFSLDQDQDVYYLCKRPHLDLFLKYIFKNFKTVSVWTAATRPYALKVIECIFTPSQRKRLAFIKARDELKVKEDGSYTKPLAKVFKSNEIIKSHNTIMIDDRRSAMADNLGNAIIVPAFNVLKNPELRVKDKSLAQLIIVLEGILENSDKIRFDTHKDVIYLKDIIS